ncbi:MAG: cyclic pyranopterin monophosphate synthase MoaC [Gemmatimonadota bacterium]|nr:cyclic pyranopterin monophosphate synthase MoaC [Gemmatimonadota bacterium]MDH5758105.1 cyclic pyranopterin monophosphate synthase MoaC [Gemmatimonadota bacterium]
MSGEKDGLTHVGPDGRPRMVDVSAKGVTSRRAVAVGHIVMDVETLGRIVAGDTAKGNVLQVAEVAGIMAGKRTADLIPLCHQLPDASVSVQLEPDPELPGVRARADARINGRTGVEMEALTAVSVALLTVYDMVKAVDRGMRIEAIRLLSKTGGASGEWAGEE